MLKLLLVLSLAAAAFGAPTLKDKNGNTLTSVTRYGVLARPPVPNQVKVFVTGPPGCTATATDDGVGFAGYIWENVGQSYLAVTPATALPATFRIQYQNDWTAWGSTGAQPVVVTFTLAGGGACTGSTALTVNTVIAAGRPLPALTYRTANGLIPGACTATNPTWFLSGAESCTYTDEPPNTLTPLSIAAAGGTATDAAWGNVITKVTSSPASTYKLHGYSAMTAFTRDNLNLWVENHGGGLGGSQDLIRLSDMSTIRSGLDSQTLDSVPSTTWDGTIRFQVATSNLIKTVFNPASGAAVSSATFNTNVAPHNLTSLWTGGTSDMTADGWIAFTDQVSNKVCALDTNGISAGTYVDKIYCADYTPYHGVKRLDSAHMTQVDRRTGKRYVLLLGTAPSGHQASTLWSVGATGGHVLNFEIQPEGHSEMAGNDNDGDGIFDDADGERGMQDGHSDVVDFDGRQFWCAGNEEMANLNQLWGACADLTAGRDMFKPVEVGGGYYLIHKLGDTSQQSDHTTCAWGGHICAFSYYNAGTTRGDVSISSATAASPAVLTVGSDPGWTTGTRVVVGAVTGGFAGCLSGRVFVATRNDATHYSLDSSNCTGAGSYSGTEGLIGLSADAGKPYRSETILFDLEHTLRAINTRVYLFSDIASPSYSAYPMASLSLDGTLIAFHSTMGFPELQNYYTTTAWTAADAIQPTVSVLATGAIVTLKTPSPRACAFTVFNAAGGTVETAATPAGTFHRVAFTGEAASTNYKLRATCLRYSATVPFTTSPTPGGSATVTAQAKGLAGVNDLAIDWGTTAALGGGTTGSSCTAGALCSVSASIPRGLIYYRTRQRDAGSATLATGAIVATSH